MTRRTSTVAFTIAALILLGSIVCLAQPQAPVTRHTRDEVIHGITPLVGHLPSNQNLRIVLVLQHRNEPELKQFLKDLQDPTSSSYRHYLTVDQFTEKYGPSVQDYEAVKSWAIQNGLHIKGTSVNRMNLAVSGSVDTIERALHVTMGLYQHPTENRTFFAPDREPTPDMPVRLWSIGGLDSFSTPHRMLKKNPNAGTPGVSGNATTGSCPGKSFCGSDMRAAYYSVAGGTYTGAGQSLGLFEFIGTDLTDLTTYFKNANQTNNVPITLTSVDTQSTLCKEPSCDDTEQTLDMTQAISMAPGMAGLTMWIGTGGLSGQSLDDSGILNGMATASPLNLQLSCSWEWNPTDATTDDPYFLEFQAQGQSFFMASGDNGNWAHAEFVWPSDDANVITVGGTDLDTTSAGGAWASETGWSDSGGGISPNHFAIPSWQVSAAAGCPKCSQKYRNGPDVSANANFSFYVCADQTTCTENEYGGTSFAAPMWAGLMALANEEAADNGNPNVGFINPAIYGIYGVSSEYAADFHDITSGGNSLGCTTRYDLSCGIGSPQQPLVDALAGPPAGNFSISVQNSTITVARGTVGRDSVTTAITGAFNSAIALSASGQGKLVQVGFRPSTIAAPGSGTAQIGIKVDATAATGTHTITITGTGGGKTQSTTITLTID